MATVKEIAARSYQDALLVTASMAPLREFVLLSEKPLVKTYKNMPLTACSVLYSIPASKALMSTALDSDKVFDFVSVKMIMSSGLFCGYLIEFPAKFNHIVLPTYLMVMKAKPPYSKVEMDYQDSNLNVFTAPQGAVLFTHNGTKYFDPNLIRDTSKTRK